MAKRAVWQKQQQRRHKKNNIEAESGYTVFTYDEIGKLKDLVEDLGWEHQRMSSDGQKSYKKLTAMLGWEFES